MKKIVIYSVAGCSDCEKAKELLRERGEDFEEIKFCKDHRTALEIIERIKGNKDPVLNINGKIVLGYEEVFWQIKDLS